MTLIHCALKCEAAPLINFFNLKKHTASIYQNEHIVLLVSGVGKAFTQDKLHTLLATHVFTQAFNIGVCGNCAKTHNIGELIVFDSTNKHLLHSVDTPQTSPSTLPFVDMEASAYIDALSTQLSEKHIHILKVVSDYCDTPTFDKNNISKLLFKHIDTIAQHIQH